MSTNSLSIERVADVLANSHDLFVEDLAAEMSELLGFAAPDLSPEKRNRILKSFLDLPAEIRFSPRFDFISFVAEAIEAH